MKAFPNMKQPEGSLYCGPYCTAACLHAFELLPLKHPKIINRYTHEEKAFNGEAIELSDKLSLEEMALEFYKVVGIVTKGENPTYIEHSGYSSLAAILYVLGEFDLNTELVISSSENLSYFKSVYPTEFELINKLNVPICILDDVVSSPNETILISLILDPVSPHYIINNSRGEWLDTNIEEVSPKWDFIEKWSDTDNKYKNSTWVGISIRIRR